MTTETREARLGTGLSTRFHARGWGLAAAVVIAAVAVFMAAAAYYQIMSAFVTYDDEGYMLMMLHGVGSGHALYDQVYSQYGPWYFLTFVPIFKLLGHGYTHDTGRIVVVGVWTLSTVLAAYVAWGVTRNLLLALAAQIVAFKLLGTLINEPMHPGGLLVLLALAMAAAAVFAARRERLAVALVGALAGIEVLVKINLGGLALIALAAAIAMANPPRLPWLRKGLVGLFVVVPFLLMAPDLDGVGVQNYAISAALGAGAIVLVQRAWDRRGAESGERLLLIAAAAAAVTALIGIVYAFSTGTSVSGLIHGVLLDPTKQREAFGGGGGPSFQPILLFAAISVVWLELRRLALGRWWQLADSVMRIVLGLALMHKIGYGYDFGASTTPGLEWAAGLAWIAALPPVGGGPETGVSRFTRVFIAALAVMQGLHAYPVSGSQNAFACAVYIVCGAIAVGDGLRGLDPVALGWPVRLRPLFARGGLVVVGVVVGGFVASLLLPPFTTARMKYHAGIQPPFAEASRLRLDPGTVERFQWVSDRVHQQCTGFITYPGMNSLHLTSGVLPPTWLNTTGWMYLLNNERQQRIVDAIEDKPLFCVIKNREVLAMWQQGRPLPDRPLVNFIEKNFVSVDQLGSDELMFRTERAAKVAKKS